MLQYYLYIPSCPSLSIILSFHLSKLHPLSSAMPVCVASVCMFLIGTLNRCPKLQPQQDTQMLHVSKGLSEDSSLNSVSTQTNAAVSFNKFTSSISMHSVSVTSDSYCSSQLVKVNSQLCYRIPSIRIDCSVSAPSPTKDRMNKLWCGVDVEPEPGSPHRPEGPVTLHQH